MILFLILFCQVCQQTHEGIILLYFLCIFIFWMTLNVLLLHLHYSIPMEYIYKYETIGQAYL